MRALLTLGAVMVVIALLFAVPYIWNWLESLYWKFKARHAKGLSARATAELEWARDVDDIMHRTFLKPEERREVERLLASRQPKEDA